MPIWEREYVAEITPTAEPAFSLQQFPVNPGQAGSFPWLANIAKNFEKYEFEYLRFIYKREVSEFATNGVTGKVIMSFDSDATDTAPTTKQQMLDTDPHADGMPCESFFMDIPQSILQRFNDAHFVRPGAQPANTDLKTFDIGTLFVACQGTAANTVVGELHVEYALRLRVPVLEAASGIGQSASLTSAAVTIAAPFQNTTATGSGGLALSGAGTTLTVTGLTVGGEYLLTGIGTGSGACDVNFTAPAGWTLKTNGYAAQNSAGTTSTSQTYTATASTATVTVTWDQAATAVLYNVSAIPTAAY